MFTAVPTKAIGDVFTADPMWNQYLRDNLNKGVTRPIAETTLAAPAASIDFTSIAADWSHLVLELFLRDTGVTVGAAVNARLNNDSAANYSHEQLNVSGVAVTAVETLGGTSVRIGRAPGASAPANSFAAIEVLILNYASATYLKMLSCRTSSREGAGADSLHLELHSGSWFAAAAAVNRVTILPGSSQFAIGSKATLYGMGGI